MKKFIPVNQPLITRQDALNVKKTLEDGWVSAEGPNVKIFESRFSKFIGHKYAVTVANGTAALEIAVQSLNLPKNSEVIIPNFTIFSNAIACLKNNLKIKPVDCGKFDWNMNTQLILKNITSKHKFIITLLKQKGLKKFVRKKKYYYQKMLLKYLVKSIKIKCVEVLGI